MKEGEPNAFISSLLIDAKDEQEFQFQLKKACRDISEYLIEYMDTRYMKGKYVVQLTLGKRLDDMREENDSSA